MRMKICKNLEEPASTQNLLLGIKKVFEQDYSLFKKGHGENISGLKNFFEENYSLNISTIKRYFNGAWAHVLCLVLIPFFVSFWQ